MKYFSKWDEIDSFLYFDFWHLKGHNKSIQFRNQNISYLKSLLEENNIEFKCTKDTALGIINNSQLIENSFADSFKLDKQNLPKLIDIFKKSEFEIIEYRKNKLTLFRQNRLINLYFVNQYIFKIFQKSKVNNMGEFYYNQNEYITLIVLKNFNILYKRAFMFIRRRYLRYYKLAIQYLLIKRLSVSKADISKQVEINYKTFLNLNIEPKNSINWILRKKHLALVTNSKKHIKVKTILKYLSNDNLNKIINNIVESDNSTPFEEPISHNKKFWNSGNNYFIYNVLFSFRKNVTSYQNANTYIVSDNSYNLYSKKYYQSLEKMNPDEIKTFLDSNPIEITNNDVTSGKHRVFAMIGWLINGNEYIPFQARVV